MALEEKKYFNYDKGLVSNVSNEALEDKELPVMKNFDFDNRGALIRRLGYKNIMPDNAVFEGTQQGYIQFIAKPYSVDDYDQLFKFDQHSNAKETYNAQEVKLLAVEGKLYLAENNIIGLGEHVTEKIFIPENKNWNRTLTIESLDDVNIDNDSFGKLKIRILSGASI